MLNKITQRVSFVSILLAVSCGPLETNSSDKARVQQGTTKSTPPKKSDDVTQKKSDVPSTDPFLPGTIPDPSSPPQPKNIVEDGLALITKDQITKEITHLASDAFEGRGTGERGNEKAGDWIVEQLKSYGVEPAQQSGYFQQFSAHGRKARNIIGMIKGSDPKLSEQYIVIGAHMDHLGIRDCAGTSRDQICNGADDNASGSTGVLNIARAMSAMKPLLKRSILFIWFSGEELGLIGSYHFVNNPVVPLNKIMYMINLDMISYAKSYGGVALLGSGTSKSAEAILKNIQTKYPQLPFHKTEKAGGGSDHIPFMAKGIPGVFFNTGVSNNPHYHRPSDTVVQPGFDAEGMTLVVKVAYEHLARLSSESSFQAPVEVSKRTPLVTPEEMAQTCHHLILNPHLKKK